MPRVKLVDQKAQKANRVRACISRYMELNSLTEEMMAKRLGVTAQTIHNRRAKPEGISLGTLWDMARVLECPISELCGGELPEERLESVLKMIKGA